MSKRDVTLQDMSQESQEKAKWFADQLLKAHSREFTFLLMGQTGVGKSSTVNSLMGYSIAPVNEFEPETRLVTPYRLPIENVQFLIVDTPGFCDDVKIKGNDLEYIQQIKSQVKHIDCLLYVTRLDETRVRPDEKEAIRIITVAFGENLWKNSLIVFTFADKVSSDKYDRQLSGRTSALRKAFQDANISTNIIDSIPTVGVDNTSLRTPDGTLWLSKLYTTVVKRLSNDGFVQYLMATAPSLVVADPSHQIPQSAAPHQTTTVIVQPQPSSSGNNPARSKGLTKKDLEDIQKHIRDNRGLSEQIMDVGVKLARSAAKAAGSLVKSGWNAIKSFFS